MLKNKRQRPGDDRGAVAVIALLFAFAAILALGALAIDTGQDYAEQAQLQNGADAAAVAVAKSCASNNCDNLTQLTTVAKNYADRNANDSASNIEQLCGSPSILGPCGANKCGGGAGAPEAIDNWVDVQTSTLRPDDSHVLPDFFGRAVLGSSYNPEIHACAQAAWGPAAIGNGFAFTIAQCDWDRATKTQPAGTTDPPDPETGRFYAPSPPTKPAASYERVIVIHNPDDPANPNCTIANSVGPVPGGFGWTDSDNQCTTVFDPSATNGWYESNGGASTQTPDNCKPVIQCAGQNVTTTPLPTCTPTSPLTVPVYDQVCLQPGSPSCVTATPQAPTANGKYYHLLTYAGFVITGYWKIPGLSNRKSWLTGRQSCADPSQGSTSQDKCFFGYFVKKVDAGGKIGGPGTPNDGVTAVQLTR